MIQNIFLCINLVVLLAYLILFAFALKKKSGARLGAMEWWRKPFYYIAMLFPYKSVGSVELDFNTLCCEDSESSTIQEYYYKKSSIFLLVLWIGNLAAVLIYVSARLNTVVVDGQNIVRNDYGKSPVEAKLSYQTANYQGEMEILVSEKKYDQKELDRLGEALFEAIGEEMKGDNESLGKVYSNLSFPSAVEGFPFELQYESGDYEILYSDGTVKNEQLEEDKVVQVTIIAAYEEYRRIEIINVHIYPKVYTGAEQFHHELQKRIEAENKDTEQSDMLILPLQEKDQDIVWSEQYDNTSVLICMIALVVGVLVYFFTDYDLHQKVEKRNQEMLDGYPELISKITMYLGAGMPLRSIFKKLGADYERKKKTSLKPNYIYEEIQVMCREMDNGVSEGKAYENWAKRCRVSQYTKLSSILSQNLRKGGMQLLSTLNEEALAAFQARKDRARKKGEEAGTKLLLPMMMMLCVVMVIIIAPAFMNFGI